MADDTSSDEEHTQPILKTTEEERQGSIPGSAQATAVAVSLSTAHGNPVVGRTKIKKKKKKKRTETSEQATQTDKK